MQPMTAMVTPGRCPVSSWMLAVTSWRSKSVRPQLGHDTYSVLVLRMRLPWSIPKEVVRVKSMSLPGASMQTPSPRPSQRRAPPRVPPAMTTMSRSSPSPKTSWCTTGRVMLCSANTAKTLREACTRDTVLSILSITMMGSTEAALASSSAVSVPSMVIAMRCEHAGSDASASAALRLLRAMALGTGLASSSAASAIMPTPTSCRRRMAVRASSSSAAGRSRRRSESEVAMSRKGMPTACLAPMRVKSAPGEAKSLALTGVTTEPSRWRTLR
mmetsp:Transcript_54987/g.174861  ORF Transcript_54987/g.174861 Transcript_54987/m.174861 type:complete len:272 (+) Transcript_54987:292-1107(+)